MDASIISYALNAGVATLAVSRASVVKISQMGVDLVLQTADGTRHVLQGVALRSMTDASIRVAFSDGAVDASSLVSGAEPAPSALRDRH